MKNELTLEAILEALNSLPKAPKHHNYAIHIETALPMFRQLKKLGWRVERYSRTSMFTVSLANGYSFKVYVDVDPQRERVHGYIIELPEPKWTFNLRREPVFEPINHDYVWLNWRRWNPPISGNK